MAKHNTTVILFGIFVSLGGFIFGYDIGYISGVLEMQPFLDDFCSGSTCTASRSGILVGILSLGTLAGALFFTPLADLIGRKWGIIANAGIYLLGVVVQMCTTGPSIRILLAGRFVAGIGVGALSALVPMYQGETTPKHFRGTMIACYQVFITAGIEVAYCVNYGVRYFAGAHSYRTTIGLQIVWGSILVIGGLWLPESPRYMIKKGRVDEAYKIVAKVRGTTVDDPDVVADVQEMEVKIREESSSRFGYIDCFRGKPKLAYRTMCGMTIQCLQQLTGANFFFYYGVTVFAGIGVTDPFVVQMIFGCIDFWCTLPGLYYFERFGRRRTLIVGGLIMFVCYYVYAIVGYTAVQPNGDPTYNGGVTLTVFASLFVFGYASSWGPGAWILTGELFPTHTRAKCISLAVASNWIWNFLIGYFSPTITDKIGTLYGLVFGSCCLFAVVFIFLCIPETRGLSLEDMEDMWAELSTSKGGLKPWQTYHWQPNNGVMRKGGDFDRRPSQGAASDTTKVERGHRESTAV